MLVRVATCAWMAAAALLLAADDAAASPRSVALVDVDHRLQRAVEVALEPWAIEVVAIETGAGVGELESALPAIARRARAGALVWIGPSDGALALSLFDADTGRTARIELGAAPPFDDPTAAAIALNIKALLRHSTLAPESERIALDPVAPDALEPRLGTEVAVSIRRVGLADQAFEPRIALAAVLRLPKPLSVAAEIEFGRGLEIDDPMFAGRLSETSIGATARANHTLGRVHLSGALGASLLVSRLVGAAEPDGASQTITRLNPSLVVGARAATPVGRHLHLGLAAGATYALRSQRYLVGTRVALDMPSLTITAGLFARLSFL